MEEASEGLKKRSLLVLCVAESLNVMRENFCSLTDVIWLSTKENQKKYGREKFEAIFFEKV